MLPKSVYFVVNLKLMVLFENFVYHCGDDDFQWLGTLCAVTPEPGEDLSIVGCNYLQFLVAEQIKL